MTIDDLTIPLAVVAAIAWALGRLQGHQQGWRECVASWKKNVEPSVRQAGYSTGYADAIAGKPPGGGARPTGMVQ